MTLEELLAECIAQNWEDMCPCEVLDLPFPKGDCEGHCAHCLLKAWEDNNHGNADLQESD